jgi:excisionase family DNA binding protein
MRELLVIGGDGNMSGMMADRFPDDMKGLLQGLHDCAQYKQIIFFPSERFLLPPENLEELLPLAEFDDALLPDARRHPDALRSKILKEATIQALSLFYEALLSFVTTGRQVVLICGQGNDLSRALLPFLKSAKEEGFHNRYVGTDSIPLLSGIKEWPVLFERFESPLALQNLLPNPSLTMTFPWDTQIPAKTLLTRKHLLLEASCPVTFPAEDALLNPRSFLLEGKRRGFLLAIPRPSNMKNFSITLQTGKGLGKSEEAPAAVQSSGKAPKVERNWMTRDEVSAAIKKSKDSVDNYCRAGRLEATKVGREIRITKASVQRYLDRTG